MAFAAITPAEIASDQPVTTTLMEKIRTNFDDHEQRLAASSGIIGEILNGSFETPQGGNPNWPDKWAIGQYAGGQVILDGSDTAHGKKALKMIHSVSGGGGGYAESDYVAISPLYLPPLNIAYKCDQLALQVEVWMRYYAADTNGDPGTYLGERCIYRNAASNPKFWEPLQIQKIPFAFSGARYAKYRLVGGVSGSAQTGTALFDACGIPIRRVESPLDNPNPISIGPTQVYAWQWMDLFSAFNVTIPAGFRWLVLQAKLAGYTISDDMGTYYYPAYCRFRLPAVAGKYSSQGQNSFWHSGSNPNEASWNAAVPVDMIYDLTDVAPGTYSVQFQGYNSNYSYAFWRSQNLYHRLTNGVIIANGTSLAFTDSALNEPVY